MATATVSLLMKKFHMLRRLALGSAAAMAALALAPAAVGESAPSPALDMDMAASIGRSLFFDSGLSIPLGQSCYNCHLPHAAFAGSDPVAEGAVSGRVGKRNVPTLMYAALIPAVVPEEASHLAGEDRGQNSDWVGGLFHDGRARDQFEQVKQPFYDPNEMNLPDEAALGKRLRSAGYARRMKRWIGEQAWQDDKQLSYSAYRALVEFLKAPLFRPFDARIDDFLAGDQDALSESETRGLEVFKNAGRCVECHTLDASTWSGPMLSDYHYHNLGVPTRGDRDPGLAGHTENPEQLGKFRTPTLRNVALTAPYMHNGSIATLREVIEFFNRRDLEPDRWGPTDYPETVDHTQLGKLGLSEQQVDDLTALMDAFTDRNLLEMKLGQVIPRVPPDVPSTASRRQDFQDWTHRLDPSFRGEAASPEQSLAPTELHPQVP